MRIACDNRNRKNQSLEVELAVAVREVEARLEETMLARRSIGELESQLRLTNQELPRLKTELNELQSTVQLQTEESAAVSLAGRTLEQMLKGIVIGSGSASMAQYTAQHPTIAALSGVHIAAVQVVQDWAELRTRVAESETEQDRLTRELVVARGQLVDNSTLGAGELSRQLAFVQQICLRIATECATPLGAIDRTAQVGLSEWNTVAEALSQQIARLLAEHRTSTMHMSENAAKVACMEQEIQNILHVAGENEERATTSTMTLQQDLAAQAALERQKARQQTEHALDGLRAQHDSQLVEQKKMLADEREHSKHQMTVVVDDYSARIRTLEAQVVAGLAIAEHDQEEHELHVAAVCGVLVRAVHGLQHQLAEVCATSGVVRRMLATGTGSQLHTDVVELVRACSPDAPASQLEDDNSGTQQRRWVSPAVTFRAAVIAVMAMHRLQLIASQAWRRYGGTLQQSSPRYGEDFMPPIRLWVEEVDTATILSVLRDRGIEADDMATQLVSHAVLHSGAAELSGRPWAARTDDLAVMLQRGLGARWHGRAVAVDRYTPAAVAMDEMRKSALGMSEQLCTIASSERSAADAEKGLRSQLDECMSQLKVDDERMSRSEEELSKANERIGRAKEDQKRARTELAAAKTEVEALRSAVIRSTEAGERAAGKHFETFVVDPTPLTFFLCLDTARADGTILALEAKERQAAADRKDSEEVKQELAVLVGVHGALEASKITAEKASAAAVAAAAEEQKRALAAQEQVTAIARELEEAAGRTAEQVEAAQEEGRQLRKRADEAAVAKEMVRGTGYRPQAR